MKVTQREGRGEVLREYLYFPCVVPHSFHPFVSSQLKESSLGLSADGYLEAHGT